MRMNEGSDDSSAAMSLALAACHAQPEATLGHPFGAGTSVFKVAGKMFAVVSLDDDPGRVTLKCDPEFATFLAQQFEEITPGYHMNKRHWITLVLAPALPVELVEELIANSYDLVRPRRGDNPGFGLVTS
jgi:predicted DNA-binding protein (MmcQ/YjbR family)